MLIVAGIVLYAVGAMRRGVFALAADLVVLVLSFLVALRVYGEVSVLLTDAFGISRIFARPIGFLGVLLLAQAVLGIVANRVLDAIPYRWHTGAASRLVALAPAGAYGAAIAGALLLVLLALPLSPALKSDVEASRLGGSMLDRAVGVERAVARIFGDAIQETLTFLTVEPEADGSIRLRARPGSLELDAESEAEMLRLVNQERAREGLPPLTVDPALVEVARAHSFDMWRQGYFSHVDPDGRDPFDRMRDGDVEFRAAGENLALAPTVEQAHQGLMDSPGHRRNILDPAFSRVGIGVVDAGIHGRMFTQNFAD